MSKSAAGHQNGEKASAPSSLSTAVTTLTSTVVTIGAILWSVRLAKDGLGPFLQRLGLRIPWQQHLEEQQPWNQRIWATLRTSSDLTPTQTILGAVGVFLLVNLLARLAKALQPDPLRDIPQAPRESFLIGNFGSEKTSEYDGARLVGHAKKLRSSVFLYPMPMGARQLVLGDNVALNHVLNDVKAFPSTTFRSAFIEFLVGDGLIVGNAQDHARQRRVAAPAFSQSHVRTLTPIFAEKAEALGEKIVQMAKNGGQAQWRENDKDAPAVINVSELMDCASFDIIGKAGFGVEFNCIEHGLEGVKLARGYQRMLQSSVRFDLPRILLLVFSGLTRHSWLSLPLCEANRVIRQQNAAIAQWTEGIIEDKVKRTQAMVAEDDDGSAALAKAKARSTDEGPVDLIEMIVRSNEALRAKNDAATMTERELRGAIRTILFAGYETSSVATSMTLHYLAHDQRILGKVQTQLLSFLQRRREETGTEEPLTADELQSEDLTLLTNCVRETLRMSPAVIKSDRVAMRDSVIPLGYPIPTRDGKGTLRQLHVPKGTDLGCTFKLPNMEERTWGPEPELWKPERWSNLPSQYHDAKMPGPAGLATFSNGPASCLGARFAMLEIVSLLVSILRRVRVEPSLKYPIRTSPVLVTRPVIKGLDEVGLPLRITPISPSELLQA